MNIIEVNNLSVSYGNNEILHNVSLNIAKKSIFGLVGYNGAGKTTLLKTIMGLNPEFKGEIKINESTKLSKQRKRIGAVMDLLEPEYDISASRYIYRICQMCGINSYEKANAYLEKVGLKNHSEIVIGKYSLGMRRRLMIACALVGDPDILVLDEPFNGIDPKGMNSLRVLLQLLSADGITILVTSHNIPELIKLVDTFGVMSKGRFMGMVSSGELFDCQKEKTVIRIQNPIYFLEEMSQKHPELFSLSSSLSEVSIFGEVSFEQINDVCIKYGVRQEAFSKTNMSGEEMLLWKMEGY